ncbi:hypothetical protein NQZ79_g8569 [Umbelopsis isabellina]|nr:hypothetical protein NQZ79_g8569 [Umbelopsis isabellina]
MSNSTLSDKRKAWDVIFDDSHLTESSLRQRAISGKVCKNGLRSVCWKIYLKAIPTMDVSKWPDIILQQRQKYSELHRTLIDIPKEQIEASKVASKEPTDATTNNPLGLNDDNPWQQHFADAEVRNIISRDVERTFPDIGFFRDPVVQDQMTDVLFVYCKLNEDISYRQGMHELLAPIFLVLHTDYVDAGDVVGPTDSTTKLVAQVLDRKFIEHDLYILFDRLMSSAKKWYEFNDEAPKRPPGWKKKEHDLIDPLDLGEQKAAPSAQLTPIVRSCRRIQDYLLKNTDPILYHHLETLGIEPQLYGLRWIRLLFGRELEIDSLLQLWDAMFAEDPSLSIVEYVCLVFLIRIRDKLVEGEYAECLSMLMRYPPISDPTLCVEQAKFFRSNVSEAACLQILQQMDAKAGKPPRESLRPAQMAPPRQQQRRGPQRAGPVDPISKLTKDMMQNPQIRDINRALVGVMGAVQKNVNTFGENVLGRSVNDVPPPAAKSNFPDGIDRLAEAQPYNPYSAANAYSATQAKPRPPSSSNKVEQARVNKPLPKAGAQYDDLIDDLHEVNAQMGQLLGKCITVLERELFPLVEEEDNTNAKVPEAKSSEVEASENEAGDTKPEDRKEPPLKDEASVIMALVGIKHVRDVLLGKQRELDVSVANQIAQEHFSEAATAAGSGKAETKADSDVNPSNDATASATAPAVPTKSDEPSSTLNIAPAATPELSTGDASPQSASPGKQSKPARAAVPPPAKLQHVPYVSPNPLPPKPSVSYNIDDLLSDTLQSEPAATNKDKFGWMMEGSNSSSSSKRGSALFSSASKTGSIKRQGTKPQTSAVSADPLDARNADKRKVYDL